jgi:hypothetical protein
MIRIFSPPQGFFMERKKTYKKPQSLILKILLIFYKVLKFILIAFLYLFGSTASKSKKPTLQEKILGEHIPFSNDRYYIPDDKY